MNAEGQVPKQPDAELKPKKVKNARIKKNVIRSKSLYSPTGSPVRARATTSDGKDNLNAEVVNNTSRNHSPIKIKRTNIKGSNKALKKRASATISPKEASNRRVIKTKIKKQSQRQSIQPSGITSGPQEWPSVIVK